jgi:hypothetical protein
MNEEFVTCDDCVNPDGCITRCVIQEIINEKPYPLENFWEDTE